MNDGARGDREKRPPRQLDHFHRVPLDESTKTSGRNCFATGQVSAGVA